MRYVLDMVLPRRGLVFVADMERGHLVLIPGKRNLKIVLTMYTEGNRLGNSILN